MYLLFLLLSMTLAYLAGSINFAILVSRLVRGIDIRSAGSGNPGTANVGREIGSGWAALVLAGDLAKGLAPIVLARALLFPEDNWKDYFALFLTGMAAITGHCWPLFFGFRGGGGLATSIGIFMFFIPVEFFTAMVIAFLTVQLFLRKKKYAFGQIIPMIFIPLAPVLVVLSSLFTDTRLFGTLKLGGHPWYVAAGVMTLSTFIFFVNIRTVLGRFKKEKTA